MKARTILVDLWGAVTSHVAITEWLIGVPKWVAVVLGVALTSVVGAIIARLLRERGDDQKIQPSEPVPLQQVRQLPEVSTSNPKSTSREPKPVRIGISTSPDGSVEVTIVTNDPTNSNDEHGSPGAKPKNHWNQSNQRKRR